jgi:hypothetical protein
VAVQDEASGAPQVASELEAVRREPPRCGSRQHADEQGGWENSQGDDWERPSNTPCRRKGDPNGRRHAAQGEAMRSPGMLFQSAAERPPASCSTG